MCRSGGDSVLSSWRLQGAKKGKAPRQRWHSWHAWQCGLCNLQNLKDARETESLSLRQLSCSNETSSLSRSPPLPQCCHGSRESLGAPTIESRFQPPPGSGACSAVSSTDRHAPPVPELRAQAPLALPDASRTCGEACVARCSIVRHAALRVEQTLDDPLRERRSVILIQHSWPAEVSIHPRSRSHRVACHPTRASDARVGSSPCGDPTRLLPV
jgi:hypothetical protein